jgi:hypothetical protein
MSDIVDFLDKLHEKRIEENNSKNERYVIRNELTKLLNFMCSYDLDKHSLNGLKNKIVDSVIDLNVKIAKDNGDDKPKDPPSY